MRNIDQECQEWSQPRLKPGGNGDVRKVRNGAEKGEKGAEKVIKSEQN